MKQFFTGIFFLGCFSVISQENAVALEDNFGVNLGLITFGLNYEFPISEKFTINSNLGYAGGFGVRAGGDVEYVFTASLGVETRYYYNRKRRMEKGKNLAQNAGNFISGKIRYSPDIGTISSGDNIGLLSSVLVGVRYGIRRNIAKNLNYEFTFGVGRLFSEDNEQETVPLFNLKLQYVIF